LWQIDHHSSHWPATLYVFKQAFNFVNSLAILPPKGITLQLHAQQVALEPLFGLAEALGFQLPEFFPGEYRSAGKRIVGKATGPFQHLIKGFTLAEGVLAGIPYLTFQRHSAIRSE
jgi:hypothetical protein